MQGHAWKIAPEAKAYQCNYSLGRGLVDDPLSLSNETRCRGEVPSTTPSDVLCEICGARGADVCMKRASAVEEFSRPSLSLSARGPTGERPAGEERRSEGRAESLSELVLSDPGVSAAALNQCQKGKYTEETWGNTNKAGFHRVHQASPRWQRE